MMRRKLFLLTAAFALSTALAGSFGLLPQSGGLASLFGQETEAEIYIVSVEKKAGEGYNLLVTVDAETEGGGEASGRALLSYYGKWDEPYALTGCRARASINLEKPQGQRNPGCFDYALYLQSLGIEAVGSVASLNKVEEPAGAAARLNNLLAVKKAAYAQSLTEEARGLATGLLFGDDSYLAEDVYEDFRRNGTAHVLSVSGLHISILYALFQKTAGKITSKPKLFMLATILALMGALASWSPSVIRSVASISLRVIAEYVGRRYDFLTATAACALVMIACRPAVVFNTGFQMSFLAVIAIAFLTPLTSRRLPDSLAVTAAANLGLMPYQIFQFNSFSLTSFLANPPVIYLTGILLPAALLDFAFAFCGIEIAPLRAAIEALAYATVKVNETTALGGRGAFELVSPPLALVVFAYLGGLFLASETFYIMRERKERVKIAAILLAFLLIAAAFGAAEAPAKAVAEADLVFVDVGQGDCLHVRGGEKEALIDGGGSVSYAVGSKTVKPYLLKNGVGKLDLALATHLHTDHYQGLRELNEEGMVGRLETGATAGRVYDLEGVKIECLWPLAIEDAQEENENCSVFMVSCGGCKILVTGDLDEAGERAMLRYYRGTDRLEADVLKLGHHGSGTSTSDEFLAAVSPRIAVIQVGKNNYGHPDAKVIEKCQKNGIIILRNDINGAVGIYCEEGRVRYETMIR